MIKYVLNGKFVFLLYNSFSNVCKNNQLGPNMGRGKHCTDERREAIKKIRNEGKSYSEIAKIFKCSKKMVENAVKYKPKPEKGGMKSKIS